MSKPASEWGKGEGAGRDANVTNATISPVLLFPTDLIITQKLYI